MSKKVACARDTERNKHYFTFFPGTREIQAECFSALTLLHVSFLNHMTKISTYCTLY